MAVAYFVAVVAVYYGIVPCDYCVAAFVLGDVLL